MNGDNCADGDIIEILNEGVIEAKEDPQSHRKYKVLNLSVRVNGLELIWSPNGDAQDILKKEYGKDTKTWVGHIVGVKIYPKTSFGVTRNAILPVILEVKV